MYRNTASFPAGNLANSVQPPSPNKPSDDSDSEIRSLLDRKRRELDEEIAQFKAAREIEFRDFKRSLRKQQQRQKLERQGKKESNASGNSSHGPGALSLLAGASKDVRQLNGHALTPTKPSEHPDMKNMRNVPSSRPTLSLDRHNVKGETTPPPLGSPLPTERLTKQISRSPSHEFLAHTPPKGRLSRRLAPATPTNEQHDSLAGVFTPSYLPLLESAANEDLGLSQLPDIKLLRHNSFSNSQTSSDLLSPVEKSTRSNTAPNLPSTSLPSALRTASGTAVRKQKRVTFQLSDSAIVPPSSSYQEISSPEPQDEDTEEMNGISEALPNGKAPGDPSPDDDSDNGLMPPFSQKQIRSPTIKGKEHGPRATNDLEVSPKSFVDDLEGAEDGGSGVGFFELDEEIASPGFGEVRPFASNEVEDLQGDAENGRGRDEDDFFSKQAFEYSGSVPIDIVRPSGSWIGSFGH